MRVKTIHLQQLKLHQVPWVRLQSITRELLMMCDSLLLFRHFTTVSVHHRRHIKPLSSGFTLFYCVTGYCCWHLQLFCATNSKWFACHSLNSRPISDRGSLYQSMCMWPRLQLPFTRFAGFYSGSYVFLTFFYDHLQSRFIVFACTVVGVFVCRQCRHAIV